MGFFKMFFRIALFSGILFILMGISMLFNGEYSGGYTTNRYGQIGYQSFSGEVSIILGVLILIGSFWIHKMDK